MKQIGAVLFLLVWCGRVWGVDWALWTELSAESVRLYARGAFRAALSLSSRALAEARLAGPGDGRLADSLDSIGLVYFQCGEYQAAERAYREAVDVAKRLPDRQARLARAMDHLASLYYETGGRAAEVETLRREAVRITTATYGVDSPEVGVLQSRLANSLMDRGKYKEAEVLLRRSLELSEEERNPGMAGDLYLSLAALQYFKGKYADALSLLDRAGRLFERIGGADTPGHVLQLLAMGTVYLKMKRVADADEVLARAEGIAMRVFGPEHMRLAQVLDVRALSLERLGKRGEAAMARERRRRIADAGATGIKAVNAGVHASAIARRD
ncbi:MAG: tetratricopeptide repeat protein [Bryobacteraceae bacterium]